MTAKEILENILTEYHIMSQPKRALISFILLLIILFCINCKVVFYGIEQGIGQLKLVRNAVPIHELLKDTNVSDSIKEKLLLVQEIKQYAIDSIGLLPSKNYNSMYDQRGEPIAWIVYASPRYEMIVYQWSFPIIGKLPYIGFFDKNKAINESHRMQKKGYDTRVGTVTAWSTLGYFNDPILSNMLFQSEGDLSELIIHELTHSTIFLTGEAQFNENLATFVGETGAKKFLVTKYGENSIELNEYLGAISDNKKISAHFLSGSRKLDSLYKTFSADLDTNDKNNIKTKYITQIINQLDTLNLYDTTIINIYKTRRHKINNAFFVGYITYYEHQNEFVEQYTKTFEPDLKKYIKYLKETYK